MRPRAHVICLAVVLVLCAGLAPQALASSAGAPHTSVQDPRGDAVARFDLGRISLRYDDTVLTVRARVTALSPRGTQILGYTAYSPEEPDGGIFQSRVTSVRRPSGKIRTAVRTGLDGYPPKTACAGARSKWRFRTSEIVVQVPRSCLPVSYSDLDFFIGAGNGSAGDPADQAQLSLPYG